MDVFSLQEALHTIEEVVVHVVIEGARVFDCAGVERCQSLDGGDIKLARINDLFVAVNVSHKVPDVHLSYRTLRNIALSNLNIFLHTFLVSNSHLLHYRDNVVDKMIDVGLGVANFENGHFGLLAVASRSPLQSNNIWIVHISSNTLQ